VWCAGREVQLTPCELRLFDILFQRAGALVSVNTLYDYVWHDEPAITGASNALAVYVRYLRRKLMGSQATVVETLRGKGYRVSRR
jgi:DNA-binding response OmpR family regulator